ncbi:strychnine-10-hydroxylase-like [Malus domestica]|uniref:strychnine-10-hydroxylase-like n=1 Tax=Malus domestica TaxID=3750 RepID=UPI0039747D9E
MSLNVILTMVAGKRYSVAADGDGKKEARGVQTALRESFYHLGMFLVGDAVPYLRWLDLGGHEKVMKKIAKELDAIAGEWVEEHKQRRAKGDAKGEQDIIDVLLSVLDGADLGGFDADTINKATSLGLLTRITQREVALTREEANNRQRRRHREKNALYEGPQR